MPHTTHAYEFESVIWEWVRGVSPPTAGDYPTLFLVIADNAIESIHAWRHRPSRRDIGTEIDRLKGDSPSWIFYDPFDAPEYAWLEWKNIERGAMEALIGRPLPAVKPDRRIRAGHTAISEYPASWGVMF